MQIMDTEIGRRLSTVTEAIIHFKDATSPYR